MIIEIYFLGVFFFMFGIMNIVREYDFISDIDRFFLLSLLWPLSICCMVFDKWVIKV